MNNYFSDYFLSFGENERGRVMMQLYRRSSLRNENLIISSRRSAPVGQEPNFFLASVETDHEIVNDQVVFARFVTQSHLFQTRSKLLHLLERGKKRCFVFILIHVTTTNRDLNQGNPTNLITHHHQLASYRFTFFIF